MNFFFWRPLFFLSFISIIFQWGSLNLMANSAQGSVPSDKKSIVQMGVQLFKDGNKDFLVLNFRNKEKWHTYWINPGDAGIPFKFHFELAGKKITLKPIEWPVPSRFLESENLITFGFKNDYSFFFPLNKQKFINKKLKIEAKWLMCKDICIPGSQSYEIKIGSNSFNTWPSSAINFSQKKLQDFFIKLPRTVSWPKEFKFTFLKTLKDNALEMYYYFNFPQNVPLQLNNNLLIPYPRLPLNFRHEKLYEKKTKDHKQIFAHMPVDWDGDFLEPPYKFPKNGKLRRPLQLKFLMYHPLKNEYVIIQKKITSFNLIEQTSPPFVLKDSTPYTPQGPGLGQTKSSSKTFFQASLFFYLFLAFLGGLILNLMPCVLPVISLKLFGLISQKEKMRRHIFLYNGYYTLGVLFTMLTLSLIVIILQTSGKSIGWGFQLQSPSFVAVLCLVIFLFSLNLFGLYEIPTLGGKTLGRITLRDAPLAQMGHGIFTTILSTPCSAPFLGVALSFAFTASPFVIVLTFLSIGLGLAFPFLMIGIFPKLIAYLPHPGPWMEDMKKFLGLSLLLTLLWLYDVFLSLTSEMGDGSFYLNLTFILSFFAILFNKVKGQHKLLLISKIIFFIFPLLSFAHLMKSPLSEVPTSTSDLTKKVKATDIKKDWEKWTPEKLQSYHNKKQQIFVAFTAKWCLTCKVNERLVLNTDRFGDLLKQYKTIPLVADWTKENPQIANWLNEQKVYGIPIYFVQKPDGRLINLGETITFDEVEEHLR